MRVEKISSLRTLPTIIEKEIDQYKNQEYYDSFVYNDDLYIVASLGMKNTLGYDISISNIIEIDKGKWEVLMDKIQPNKDQILAQAITTPLAIVKIIIMTKGKILQRKLLSKTKRGYHKKD